MKRKISLIVVLAFFTFAVNAQPKSIRFSQGTNKVIKPNIDFGSTKNFTMETWVKINGNMNDYAAIAVVRPVNEGLILRSLTSSSFSLSCVRHFEFRHPTNLIAGNWYHVAYVMQNDSVLLYVNGIPALITTNPINPINFQGNLHLGVEPSIFQRYLNGDLDDFRMWSRALSEAEILASYNNTCPIDPQQEGLEIYYDFGGNRNNGQVTLDNYITNLVDLNDKSAVVDIVPNVFPPPVGFTFSSATTPILSDLRTPLVEYNRVNNRFNSFINLDSNSLSLQWYNCSTQQDITGENGSSLLNPNAGLYSIKATDNTCTLISECSYTVQEAPLNNFAMSDSVFCEGLNDSILLTAEIDESNIPFNYEVKLKYRKAGQIAEEWAVVGNSAVVSYQFLPSRALNQAELFLSIENPNGPEFFESRVILFEGTLKPEITASILSASLEEICPETAATPLNFVLEINNNIEDLEPNTIFRFKKISTDGLSASVLNEYTYTGSPATINMLQIQNPQGLDLGKYFIEIDNNCGVYVNSDTIEIKYNCNKGRSINFNAPGSVITMNDPDFQHTGPDYTLECWLRSTSAAQREYAGVVVSRPAAQGFIIRRTLNTGGANRLAALEDFDNLNGPNLTNNQWHHAALVKSGYKLSIYLDGVEYVLSNNFTGNNNFSNHLAIGNDVAVMNRNFVGDIDEVKFWSRALTPAEIQATFEGKCPSATNDEDLMIYFNFNEGDANANNMSIANITSEVEPFYEASLNLSLLNTENNFTQRTPISVDFDVPSISLNQDETIATAITSPDFFPYAYQWYDCTLGDDILGENDSTFSTQSFSGNYGVKVSFGGCTLPSSNCPNISVSTDDITFENESPLFYPNPAQTWIYTSEPVRIYNSNGQLVLTGKEYLSVEDLTPGLYLVISESRKGRLIIR